MLGSRFPTRKIASIAILCLLILSVHPFLENQSQSVEKPKEVYTVYVTPNESRDLVAEKDVVASYDSFLLARLTDSEVLNLRGKGINVMRERNLSTIALDGFVFDTREGVPDLVKSLRIQEPSDRAVHSYILQFIGPIEENWVRKLESDNVLFQDYIPYNAFLVRMTPKTREEVERYPFVQWVGFYEPVYRVKPTLWSSPEETLAEVILFKDKTDSPVLSLLGNRVVKRYNDGEFNIVEARVDSADLLALAKLDGVYYIEPRSVMIPFNRNAQAVFQTNKTPDDPTARRIWDMGIDGTGQIITVADTGLDFDHAMFRESKEFPWVGDIYNITDMNRRKLVRYIVMRQIDPESDPWAWRDSAHRLVQGNLTSGHGTSVAAAAAGSDDGLASSPNDGMAKGAKLIVQDIGTVCKNPLHGNWWDDCLSYIPSNYSALFLPPYLNGSRIHSNSWGSINSDYDREARMVDMFMWRHPDMTIAFANGNGGPCSYGLKHNTGSPATAKSVLSIGMTEGYPNQHNVSCGSSTGPTADGRRKPTVLAFGSGRSAWSSGDPYDEYNISSEGWFGGSSYATPLVSGLAALVRQYFEEGWYPTGEAEAGNSFNPSAALVKAVIVTSGQEMRGNNSDMAEEGLFPNLSQGWGRPLMDDVLYFQGDKRKLIVRDSETIDYTGQEKNYSFVVKSGEEPLKITLVWTDYPASLLSAVALVNDLNLLVIDPTGKEYKGNVFWTYSDSASGESRPDYGVYDILNPVEGVVVRNPIPGEWTLRITGYDIPKGPQPFAFVITGIVGKSYHPALAPPTNLWAELEGPSLENVKISWNLSVDDPALVDHYAIYYGTVYNGDGYGYHYLDRVARGAGSYLHLGAGDGDLSNYYYYIQSNGTDNQTGRSLEQVGKFVRNLEEGMQMVSFPLQQKVESVEVVLQTIWDNFDMIRIYDSNQRVWKSLWRIKGYGGISSLSHAIGFWIRMTVADSLVVAGRVVDGASVLLHPGWNLLGYPMLRDSTLSKSFSSVTYLKVEGYDSASPYHLRTMGENSITSPGYAYWVHVDSNQVWRIYNY